MSLHGIQSVLIQYKLTVVWTTCMYTRLIENGSEISCIFDTVRKKILGKFHTKIIVIFSTLLYSKKKILGKFHTKIIVIFFHTII